MVRVRRNYIQGVLRIAGSRRTTAQERLKIATYNGRTLLNDEHVQELEEELKENNMKVIGLGDVRRKEESFTTLQSGHLPYHSEANNGQAGVGFLVNKKWKDNRTRVFSWNSRVAELVLRITKIYQMKIVQVDAPTTSHSDEETDNFYTTNTRFHKKAGGRWTWRCRDGHTKNEIDYIMTDKPSMVTDVTLINRRKIVSDHRMVMVYVTLNTREERKKLLNNNRRTRVDTQMIATDFSQVLMWDSGSKGNDWNEEEHVSTGTEKTGSRH